MIIIPHVVAEGKRATCFVPVGCLPRVLGVLLRERYNLRMLGRWRWLWVGVRLAIVVWVVVCGLNPPRGLVLLGPQQQVQSINDKIGVHTRLTDEVEEWKIKRSLELVREMGASWIIEYFPWAYSEPEPDVYRWEHADMVIGHARRQGLQVIARVGFGRGLRAVRTPTWLRNDMWIWPTFVWLLSSDTREPSIT
jgi:hypothetical protein